LRSRTTFLLPIAAILIVGLLVLGYFVGRDGGGAQTLAATVPKASQSVSDDEAVPRVAAQLGPSVVQVNVRSVEQTPSGSRSQEGLGSGVIYSEVGYIITSNHVVQGARQVNVAFADGSTEQGEVVGTDETTDLAVVKVDRQNLPVAKFGDSANLVVGQLAVAIGSPSGFQSTVTSGVVSGLNREVPANLTGGRQKSSLVDLIQTDAPISPGNSGGALGNRDDEVIGINVAYLPPKQTGAERIGFSIPSNTATEIADQLIQNGSASHPRLGVSLADLTPEIAQRFGTDSQPGALVVDVDPNGPSASAGIEPKDVITAIGSTKVENTGDLLTALRGYQPGDNARLTVSRDGRESQIEVMLDERNS